MRSTPAGTALGQQSSGSLGVVIGGPSTATLNGTSYTWYDVDFDTGVDGWVADSGSAIGLTVVTPAAPTQNSPAVRKVTAPRPFVLQLVDELKAVGQEVNSLRLGEHTVAKTVCRHAVKANDPLAGRNWKTWSRTCATARCPTPARTAAPRSSK